MILATEADLARGVAGLCRIEPRFAPVIAAAGPLPLRRRPEGFAELLRTIVFQHVSLASAEAVWSRLSAAGLTTPEAVLAASDDRLGTLGLTRQKQRYARALAAAGIDYDALRDLDDDAVLACLMAVTGIGRWTAECYLAFSLGRADVLPAGDVALQEGARQVFDLPARPAEREMRALAAHWSPWRAVAARALWAYYLARTNREGDW